MNPGLLLEQVPGSEMGLYNLSCGVFAVMPSSALPARPTLLFQRCLLGAHLAHAMVVADGILHDACGGCDVLRE